MLSYPGTGLPSNDPSPHMQMNPIEIMMVVLGLLFVTVSSRLTGEIGTSHRIRSRHDR